MHILQQQKTYQDYCIDQNPIKVYTIAKDAIVLLSQKKN